MNKVAWIGTGVMGASMAAHLTKAGYPVSAYNRHPAKAEALRDQGITPCASIQEAVRDADFIFTIVGYPKDVEEVYLSDGGIFAHAKSGAIAVDMTTSSPSLAEKLYQLGQAKGIHVMDAPVSGGDSGARAGTLSIMVGGDQVNFDAVLPLFEAMGKSILLMGPAGSGQHTKACNQICVAGATAAYTEAIVYAQKVGLDPEKMLSAISGGAAGSWQINNMAPRALKGDLAPGFFVKHFVKDMQIVQDEAKARGVSFEMLDAVLHMYTEMVEKGYGDDGTQALIKLYED